MPRLPRKTMLLSLMVLFIVGNLLSALAPSYGVLMVGRFLSAFAHGAYFGVGSVVAADLVAPQKRASAIALMFTGLTLANVLGVPLGTWIGQAFGWRATFWVVVVIGVVGLIGVLALVPAQPRPEGGGLLRELVTFRKGGVWLALAMTVFGFAPVFAVITFISPIMTSVGGFSSGTVPVVMALFGVAAFATVPPLQTRVLDAAAGAPTLASAANIGAFNLGNAIGSFVAGLTIDAGFGYTAPAWTAALLGLTGLAVAGLAGAQARRHLVLAA